MKPHSVATILCTVAFLAMCSAPTHAEVVDGMAGQWKAAGGPTIFEVFPDGRYQSTINGVVVETGNMNATNGTWSIRANSGRVDNGSFTLHGGNLQLKGVLGTTMWNRISKPTVSSTSAASPASTVAAGASAPPDAATAPAATGSESTTTPLSDKEKAMQRFQAKHGARSGGWVQNPPGGVMNDRQARKFWKGY